MGLGTAHCQPEAGDDLVENQECAVPGAELLDPFQVPGRGWRDGGGLHDDAGELARTAVQQARQRLQVVVGK